MPLSTRPKIPPCSTVRASPCFETWKCCGIGTQCHDNISAALSSSGKLFRLFKHQIKAMQGMLAEWLPRTGGGVACVLFACSTWLPHLSNSSSMKCKQVKRTCRDVAQEEVLLVCWPELSLNKLLSASRSVQVALCKFLCACAQRTLRCTSCSATQRKLLCASCSVKALCASCALRHSSRS